MQHVRYESVLQMQYIQLVANVAQSMTIDTINTCLLFTYRKCYVTCDFRS